MTANVTLLSAEARADIQGFVTSGYGDLPFAAYIFVKISDEAGARRWLGQLVPTVTSTFDWPEKARRIEAPSTSVNVCFTADGLRACGLTDDVMCTFPPEFREGIVTPARSRILGDTQGSDPSRWEFGGPGAEPLHALLIVHGYTEEALVAACTAQRELIAASKGAVVRAWYRRNSGACARREITSRSGSMTASRSRRSTASKGPVYRPASSSSDT